MVTRAEYLARSVSRRKPWLAQGISRRTWERRQHKINAVEGSQAKNPTPNEASASKPPRGTAGQSSAVNSARKTNPERRAPATMARAEYLERSLSRQQPWLAEEISRRTWERRQRKSTEAKSTRAKRSLTASGRSRKKAQHVAIGSGAHTTPVPRDKRISAPAGPGAANKSHPRLLGRARDKARRHASGGESNPLDRVTGAVQRLVRRSVGQGVQTGERASPAAYDRWIGLIEKWDRAYSRHKARDLVDRLITALADRPPRIVDRMFGHLERQICDHLPKKVRRLEYECVRLKSDEWHFPDFRRLKTDAIKEHVYAALADGAKTKKGTCPDVWEAIWSNFVRWSAVTK